ncbi:MAG: ABA4-like family protein [Xanthomonadales bacterium]|nr:ABA4-like family protein [Xanthomonadales bacterium]
MGASELFPIFNYGVLPFWALLVFAPRARLTATLVHTGLAPIILCAVYTVLFLVAVFGDSPQLDFGSIEGVRNGFQGDIVLLAGWVHYLAFDLFIGAWCCRDARRHDISHLALVPILVVVLMAGPAGLLLYLGLKGFRARRFTLSETIVS